MRRSSEGQAAFARAEEREDEDWMEEASRMQLRALREVGIAPTQRNLALLRSTALEHPELALYVRNNKCRQGALAVGDRAPVLQLHELDGTPRRFPAEATARPQVVFAGSVS